MGAIAGVIDMQINENIKKQMLMTMKRRGPFEHSIYSQNNRTLFYASASSDHMGGLGLYIHDQAGERYVICFDGTVYNRKDLLSDLVAAGYVPDGDQDAELVLMGYLCWKEEVLEKINGVFSFAILEEKRGQIFLARDRIGVRPLFYKILHDGGIIFASEMKTILTVPSVDAELDANGVMQLCMIGPGRVPGSGVFKGITEVKPGYCGMYFGGNLQLRRYWRLRDRIHTEGFEETAEIVRYLLTDSVRMQISSIENVGTMLSGGLDSSIISAICGRELDAKDHRLYTFSLDYLNNAQYFAPERFQPSSDNAYIRIMQEYLDSQHRWTVLSTEELLGGICDATIARDLPGMADIDISLLTFCRNIHDHMPVVLSGECADEIFGGYPWYRDAELRDFNGFPWARTTAQRAFYLPEWVTDQINPEEFVMDHYRQAIAKADILPECVGIDRKIKELVNLNFDWFMQSLLERGDRMGSYFNVDIRMPFCDYRIAEYLYAVPWWMKDHKGMEKGLLRHAMRSIVPDAVLYRKKSPFPKTYDPQYAQCASELMKSVLQERDAPILQIIRREALENLLHESFEWPWYGQLMRRPQTIVYMLQINYWLKHYSVRIV